MGRLQKTPRASFVRTIIVLGLAALLVLLLKGDALLLQIPGSCIALSADVIVLAACVPLCLAGYTRGSRRWPGQRLLWVTPISELAILTAVTLGLMTLDRLWTRDFFQNLVGLPPYLYNRMVMLHMGLVFLQVMLVFLNLIRAYWADEGKDREGADPMTGWAVVAFLAVILVLVSYWRFARPESMEFFKIWFRFSSTRRPDEALRSYEALRRQFPDAPLLDAVHYRMGRLNQYGLLQNHEARDCYRRLIDRFPGSPLRDDALLEVGRISLQLDELPVGQGALETLLVEYPGSYLTEEALLVLVDIHLRANQAGSAREKAMQLREFGPRGAVLLEIDEGRFRSETIDQALQSRGL